jgi:hypothetical protein
MLGPATGSARARSIQPAEAALGVLRRQSFHPIPLASCDEYGRICNSERDRQVVTPKNRPAGGGAQPLCRQHRIATGKDPRGQGRLSLGGCRPEAGDIPRPAPRHGKMLQVVLWQGSSTTLCSEAFYGVDNRKSGG